MELMDKLNEEREQIKILKSKLGFDISKDEKLMIVTFKSDDQEIIICPLRQLVHTF